MRHILLYTPLLLLMGCGQVTSAYDRRPTHPIHSEIIVSGYAYYGFSETTHRKRLKEITGVDPVQTEWCAAYVNAILRQNGIEGSESVSEYPLTARSFLAWGTPVREPKSGDVVIFPRGEPWQGHVGFYVRTALVGGEEQYVILGGNQNDMVSLEYYPASKAIGIRRP